jgi:5'-3' exonuclease
VTEERPVILVDSYNLFMRAFTVNPAMSSQGQQIGGFVGYLTSLKVLCERLRPKRVVAVWEGGGAARRRAIFKDYKSGRRPARLNRYYEDDIPDTPENQANQIRLIIEALRHLPVQQVYVPDCEADDVIGYISRHLLSEDRLVIVSSDRDLYQLIDDRVTQWSPGQKKFIRAEDVQVKFGVPPPNMALTRSFIGDASDNIPGIEGAGFKTMVKRFPQLSTNSDLTVQDILDAAQAQLDGGSKVKLVRNILDGVDTVRRNWRLMHLDVSNLSADQVARVQSAIDSYEPRRDKMGLMRLLAREGVQKFDVDSFFMSLAATAR